MGEMDAENLGTFRCVKETSWHVASIRNPNLTPAGCSVGAGLGDGR